MRRQTEASRIAIERRERENAARRLREVVPELAHLKLYIEEKRTGSEVIDVTHTRLIVIDRAPALFEIGCSDRNCTGNHDLTGQVLRALRAHVPSFEGSDCCHGESKDGSCCRELHFRAEANYAA